MASLYLPQGCEIQLLPLHRVCWSRFYDPQTPVVRYFYQVFQLGGGPNGSDVPIIPPVNVSLNATSAEATNLQLQVNMLYIPCALAACLEAPSTCALLLPVLLCAQAHSLTDPV
jgi:hypothetical protein